MMALKNVAAETSNDSSEITNRTPGFKSNILFDIRCLASNFIFILRHRSFSPKIEVELT